MSEEKSAYEVMQIFRDEEKIHCLEGERAIEGLNKICAAIGYNEQCYRNGSSLEEFLRDNPGCCDSIVEWIIENMGDDWKEGLSFEDNIEDTQGNEDEDTDKAYEADEQATSDLMASEKSYERDGPN